VSGRRDYHVAGLGSLGQFYTKGDDQKTKGNSEKVSVSLSMPVKAAWGKVRESSKTTTMGKRGDRKGTRREGRARE